MIKPDLLLLSYIFIFIIGPVVLESQIIYLD